MRLRGIAARLFAPAAIATLVIVAAGGAAGGTTRPGGGDVLALSGVHWTKTLQPGGARLYTVRADGTALRPLTRAGAWSDAHPAWRSDGRQIAFGRTGSAGWRVYIANAGGTNARALTARYALADSPTWSPNGRSIAFEGLPLHLPPKGSLAQQVYVTTVTGHTSRLTSFAAFKGGAGKPAWSPDGARILFWGSRSSGTHVRPSIWSIRPNGTGLHRLLVAATDPAWSADGKRIAFVRRGDIYTARADGKGVVRVTHLRAELSRPAWSPDGTRIAYALVHRAKNQAYDTQRIWVVNADGSGRRPVTPANARFWTTAPAWRPAQD